MFTLKMLREMLAGHMPSSGAVSRFIGGMKNVGLQSPHQVKPVTAPPIPKIDPTMGAEKRTVGGLKMSVPVRKPVAAPTIN